MQVMDEIAAVRSAVVAAQRRGQTCGFVPTMGALHAGHVSLMQAARPQHDLLVVSIFVNPTQFGPQEDLQKYPRPRDRDLEMCRDAGVDIVFYPAVEEMYRPGAQTFVTVEGLTDLWEGAIRPGHFRGVTTVVTKLFQIVPADAAYFGQKDYQQQAVIRQMVRDLDLPIVIHTCPTLRDPDGLAMSSRNAYLSPAERTAGLCLWRALCQGEADYRRGAAPRDIAARMQQLIANEPGVQLDYAAVVDPQTLQELDTDQPTAVALVAARVGSTRLIDNAIWGGKVGGA